MKFRLGCCEILLSGRDHRAKDALDDLFLLKNFFLSFFFFFFFFFFFPFFGPLPPHMEVSRVGVEWEP